MDNSTPIPIHNENKFTTCVIAGRAYLFTEASALGQALPSTPPSTWWFGRNRAGGSSFRTWCPITHVVTNYDFVRESTTDVGKRCEYLGSDGSLAFVYL